MNLHLTVLFVHHKNHTGRSVDYSDINITNICALKKQQELDSDKKTNPESPTIDLKDVSNTYESMNQ